METKELNEVEIENLREEFANTMYNVPIQYDEEYNVYYQVVEFEEGEQKVDIEERFYPVVSYFM